MLAQQVETPTQAGQHPERQEIYLHHPEGLDVRKRSFQALVAAA